MTSVGPDMNSSRPSGGSAQPVRLRIVKHMASAVKTPKEHAKGHNGGLLQKFTDCSKNCTIHKGYEGVKIVCLTLQHGQTILRTSLCRSWTKMALLHVIDHTLCTWLQIGVSKNYGPSLDPKYRGLIIRTPKTRTHSL